MANHRLFIWQRRLSVAVVAISVGYLGGLSLPIERSPNQKTVIPIKLPVGQLQSDSSSSEVKALIAQRNEAYKKVITKLAAQEKAKRLNFSVPVQFQGKTIRDVKIKSQPKANSQVAHRQPIALTFDDGPWQNSTSQVLAVLKKYNVKATFFVVGKQVQNYPQLAKQLVAEGHAIGNHSWSHQYHQFNHSTAAHELDRTADLVYKTTGVKTSLFRPPAGILTNGLVAYAHQKKYAVVMWSMDSKDWHSRRITPQAMADNLLKEAKPGGIVLLHDGGGDRSKTVQALPRLITELKKRGYEFVTVPELLQLQPKEVKKGKA